MEQTTVANKPNFPLATLDHLSDPPNKLAIAVIAVMSEHLRRRVKLVQAAVCRTKPQIAATIAGDALNRTAADAVGIVGVVTVAGTAFGSRVEFVYASSIGGNPQIAMVVFHQIHRGVVAYARGFVGVIFVPDEGVAIIAIDAVSGGKPHEAPAILQNGNN